MVQLYSFEFPVIKGADLSLELPAHPRISLLVIILLALFVCFSGSAPCDTLGSLISGEVF